MAQPRWNLVFTRAITTIALSTGLAGTPVLAATTPSELVYVGSNQSNQIRAARFDAATGKLTMIAPVADGLRPTWLVSHPQLPMLYAVNDERAKEGSVVAFAVDRASGALTKINTASTGGEGSTHLWLDTALKTLFAANFTGGSAASIALQPDGSLGALVSTVKETGTGPHPRQTSAHAHGVALDPSGRYLLVADLGADRVFVYGVDRASKALAPDDATNPHVVSLPAGSGPRHLAFGANGRFVYVVTELSADIVTLRWDAQQGRLTPLQSLPMSSPEFKAARNGSEVAVSADGRFVYAGNRAEHQLLVYRVDAASGELSLIQRVSSGGELPWNFALHSSGKWMLVANQRSGKVNVFSVDPASGMVADTGQAVDIPTPVSVAFVR